MIDCYISEIGYWQDYKNEKFKRYIYVADALADKVINERYSNVGVFKTAYKYNTKDINNSYLLGDFYLDFDDKENFENVREDVLTTINLLCKIFKLKIDEINIYFSGGKGIHLTVSKEVLGIQPSKHLNVVFKYIMNFLRNQTKHKTIDIKIYDNKRLFRVSNSKHEKTGLYKIRISYDELKSLEYDSIRQLATNKRLYCDNKCELNNYASNIYTHFYKKAMIEFNRLATEEFFSNSKKKIRDTPPCIQKLIDDGPVEGTRNNTIAILTSFYYTKGLTYQETKMKLLEWACGEISEVEINRTLKSMYHNEKRYGCRTLKIYSECDYDNCPLMKGRRRKK